MSRFLYHQSVAYRGYLVIPLIYGMADGQTIYSYRLLSELGHRGRFHNVENPADRYATTLTTIIELAQEHLDLHSDRQGEESYFKRRYTYRDNLIIVFEQSGKYFYDHYPPDELTNIAAPKIFSSERECLEWIKQGIDRLQPDSVETRP